jgi:hypothetical protein
LGCLACMSSFLISCMKIMPFSSLVFIGVSYLCQITWLLIEVKNLTMVRCPPNTLWQFYNVFVFAVVCRPSLHLYCPSLWGYYTLDSWIFFIFITFNYCMCVCFLFSYKFSQPGEIKKRKVQKVQMVFFVGSSGHTMKKKILKLPYLKNRSQQENSIGVLQKALWLYNPYTPRWWGKRSLKHLHSHQYMACTLSIGWGQL